MSYELTIERLPNFLRYVNKVYRFSQTIDSMQSNCEPETSPQTIYMSMFLCMLLRLGSLRQLASDVKSGRIRKFLSRVDKETYCANTVANGLESIDTHILQQELAVVPKKLRRNKAYGSAEHPRTIGGLRIVAVDGTEHFRSERIHCSEMHGGTRQNQGRREDPLCPQASDNVCSGPNALISSSGDTGW